MKGNHGSKNILPHSLLDLAGGGVAADASRKSKARGAQGRLRVSDASERHLNETWTLSEVRHGTA
jgi:hypothetical protein